MEHDLIEEIRDRYADIQRDGCTAVDAIADVLDRHGFIVISKRHYHTLLVYRNKYVQILKIVEQSHEKEQADGE